MPRFDLFSLLFTCSKHLTRHDNDDTFSMQHLSKQPPPTAVPLQLASQAVSEEASSEHVEEKAGSGAHTLKASFSHSALEHASKKSLQNCLKESLEKGLKSAWMFCLLVCGGGSHIAQAGLKFPTQLTKINPWSYLFLQSARNDYTCTPPCVKLRMEPRTLHARQALY